jgi:hypothetical protein
MSRHVTRQVTTVIIVPADANYRVFFDACKGPCWQVDVPAGHLQFLDASSASGLMSMFAGAGPTPDAAVRAVAQGAAAAWLRAACGSGGGSGGSSGSSGPTELRRVLDREAASFASMAPGTRCRADCLDQLPGMASGSGGSSSSSRSSNSGASGGNGRPSPPRPPGVAKSYDELIAMRASELKRILNDRGVPCKDCFDKESLARRVVERCA